ncbi:UNVERIFIED_CONTAM: hypothetical protein GTU68_028938 [Idotea baltica]|nr:hypothetical protein [Idotea baltica]
MSVEYLGYIAAILTTGSFLPQLIKTVKTKDTSGISLTMYFFLVLGITLWFIYGICLDSMPIILANLFTGIMATIILYYKIKEALSKSKK